MDCDQKQTIADLGDKAASIFSEFMLRVAKFEELVDIAHQFLVCFHHELETFRRPQLYKTSQVVDHIIEVNQTERMKAYVEAGSRHQHQDVQHIIKLHSCSRGLQEHLMKVKSLLDELGCRKEDAVEIAREANQSATQFVESRICDEGKGLEEGCLDNYQEDMEFMHIEGKSMAYATLMVVIYNMLRLDYMMQENIINSIKSASAKSEQLESYCLMWSVHPYINDDVMRQSWKLVS